MITVHCKEIKKSYGDEETLVHALRGISFEASQGELLMLVGPSGCGKTTLLSIISGILRADSGECTILGQNLAHFKDDPLTVFRRINIGFIFQNFNLIPTLTAIENVSIPLVLSGMNKWDALKEAANLLARVGLKERAHALPIHMSGGEQQRVAICRGCIHKPKLIVCDEPTSALDHETGQAVLSLFKEIALTKESCLVIVTHDARIFDFADRILKMEDGLIVGIDKNHVAKNEVK